MTMAEGSDSVPENPGSGGRAGSGRLRRRRYLLIGVVSLAVAASVGGLLLATTIKSPAEQAAQAAPPSTTQLTVPVTRQTITSTVLAQGVVKPPAEVAQLSGADSGGGGGSNGELPVVTRVFHPVGSIVEPGQPIVEVAGRPLFAFAGSVPAYRNLVPGESGTDVAQLQQGLAALGYSLGGDTLGEFGAGTGDAVSAFYAGLGYTVPTQQVSTPTAKGGKKAGSEPMVPLSEIMFVPRFPARVVKVAGPVGQEASGSLVTLSMGSPSIAGQLSPGDAALVRSGMPVRISDTATGLSRAGRVTRVGQRTQTTGSISGGVYLPMKIVPSRALRTSLAGHDVTLTITAAHSARPLLAVPEAAVFARADGRIYVTRAGPHGNVQVPVRVDVTGNGIVGVTPIDGGTLAPGDRVVIGANFARNLP